MRGEICVFIHVKQEFHFFFKKGESGVDRFFRVVLKL